MNFSKFILVVSLFSIAIQMPMQASNFGLKSRAIIGLFAAGGSALATGAAAVADSFKKNELSNAQLKISHLENELNYQYVKQIMADEYASGIIVGAMGTLLALILVVIAFSPDNSTVTSSEKNDLAGNDITQINANDSLQNDTELAVKA